MKGERSRGCCVEATRHKHDHRHLYLRLDHADLGYTPLRRGRVAMAKFWLKPGCDWQMFQFNHLFLHLHNPDTDTRTVERAVL